jgi:hypothetical protein
MTETNAIDCSAAEDERRPQESSVQPDVYVPMTSTFESLKRFDKERKLKLTFDQAWAILEWYETTQVEHGSETRSAG